MQDVICKKCNSVNDYTTQLKANNNVAYCNQCGSYIKNIPHAEPTFYVGKYKDRKISEIDDLNYLQWAHKEMKLSSNIREAVQKQIDKLSFLAK